MNGKLTDRRRFSKMSIVKKKTEQEKYVLQAFRIHGLAMDFYEEKKVSKADNAMILTTLRHLLSLSHQQRYDQIPGCLFVVGSCRSSIVHTTNQNVANLVSGETICTFDATTRKK